MPEASPVAAGGVPWQYDDGRLLLGVVHRSRYDDWSFPKGKLLTGEHPLQAAVREVAEETGLSTVVGRRLPRVTYTAAAGPKTVDYWSMAAAGTFGSNDETDALEWLSPDEALRRLTYADDQALVGHLLAVPLEPVRVLVVRHARAGDSESWPGPDLVRPLDPQGEAEARALAGVLPLFAPDRILSANPLRCRQTVHPAAERLGLPVDAAAEFGELEYAAFPAGARRSLAGLLRGTGVTAVCSQGGIIPDLLGELLESGPFVTGVPQNRRDSSPPARKGSVWALTARDGRVVSADYYATFLTDYPS